MKEIKICLAHGCGRTNEVQRFKKECCEKHYQQLKKHGEFRLDLEREQHGLCDHHLYNTWKDMLKRCNNQNSHAYEYYGGRGIKVCPEWQNSFTTFLADMGEKPSPKHSLDRKNNDLGYSKANCRWATKTEQATNQRIRKDNKYGHKGVCRDKAKQKWLSNISIRNKRFFLGAFDKIEDAIAARKAAEEKYR